MKLKENKIFFCLLVLPVIACVCFIYFYNKYPIVIHEPRPYKFKYNTVLDKKLSKVEVKEDREQIIHIMEKTHPIFLEDVPKKYYYEKENFKKETNRSMYVYEFQLVLSKYLSSIEDGHTRIIMNNTKYLDIDWKYSDGKLILLDDNKRLTDKVVTEINGVKVDKVTHFIKDLFPEENYVAESRNNSKFLKEKLILENAGVDCSDSITLNIKHKSKEEKIKLHFKEKSDRDVKYEISSKKINDNTIYINLGICEVNSDFDNVLKNLDKEINREVKNVIVDVRDNPGGDSTACNKILETLNMKAGNFGSIIRFSPLAKKTYGYLKSTGTIEYKRNNDTTKNEDIDLYIITNENTFSSAQWMATLVQDGGLGTIVGQPSSNMPSSFGDILGFQLKNSKLEGQISYKKWTRPDKSKDKERTLEPNIKVKDEENPVDIIIEKLKG